MNDEANFVLMNWICCQIDLESIDRAINQSHDLACRNTNYIELSL